MKHPARIAPAVEILEARIAPASVITIIDAGPGTLDDFLSFTDGTITAADGGLAVGTLSRAALQSVASSVSISIEASASIVFNDLAAPLGLATASGQSASFMAANDITLRTRMMRFQPPVAR